MLIAENGALVGVMTPEGRALSRAKGAGFVASNWLENDGDPSSQEKAAERWATRPAAALPVIALSGKRAAARLDGCDGGAWVVLNVARPPEMDEAMPCTVLGPAELRETGALALYQRKEGVFTVSARQITGARMWNTR